MSDFFYLQRTPRPRQHGRHRARAGKPGRALPAVLLVIGVALTVWAVLW